MLLLCWLGGVVYGYKDVTLLLDVRIGGKKIAKRWFIYPSGDLGGGGGVGERAEE